MPLDALNLVKWFRERPFWIQEAARLLLAKENLTAADLSGLVTLCKQQAAEPETTPKPTVRSQTDMSKSAKVPAFVTRAERAMRRAAKNIRAQNRAMKLPLIVWQDGKVVQKPA